MALWERRKKKKMGEKTELNAHIITQPVAYINLAVSIQSGGGGEGERRKEEGEKKEGGAQYTFHRI